MSEISVEIDYEGDLGITGEDRITRYIKDEYLPAVRSFFQAERDEQLGRWRDPENPDWVVYPLPQQDDRDGRCVRVVCEREALYRTFWEHEVAVRRGETKYGEVARNYFAAHPEPRPWHDAETGEGWLLTIEGEERLAVVDDEGEFVTATRSFEAGDDLISAGRRIWPTDSESESGDE